MSSIRNAFNRAPRLALALVALGLAPSGSQAQTAMSFYPLTPCRIFDTRTTHPPKVGGNSSRNFPVRGGTCGVPGTAQAAILNMTVTACTDFGNIRVYPAGSAAPLASWLNFLGDGAAIANGGTVPLGDSGGSHIGVQVDMPSGSPGQCHVLSDVTGYFQ